MLNTIQCRHSQKARLKLDPSLAHGVQDNTMQYMCEDLSCNSALLTQYMGIWNGPLLKAGRRLELHP